MRPDKDYRRGVSSLLSIFRGEMMTLGYEDEEIIEAVIEECDSGSGSLAAWREVRQQFRHLEEIRSEGEDQ